MMETLAANPGLAEQSIVDKQFWNLIGPLAEEFGFATALAEELNVFQKVARATNDIVTPGNAIDVLGFTSSMYGIQHLDSYKGIFAAMVGFMADFADGKAARATGTQSNLGEAIDAGGDKVKLAFALYKIWQLELAPKSLIMAIAVQNGLNVVLTGLDRRNNKPPVLHASQAGKAAIFIEQWGLGLHVIGTQVAKNNERRGKALKTAGTILGVAGVSVGAVATVGYARTLWAGRS